MKKIINVQTAFVQCCERSDQGLPLIAIIDYDAGV